MRGGFIPLDPHSFERDVRGMNGCACSLNSFKVERVRGTERVFLRRDASALVLGLAVSGEHGTPYSSGHFPRVYFIETPWGDMNIREGVGPFDTLTI